MYSSLLLQCVLENYVIKWTTIRQTIKIVLQVGLYAITYITARYNASKVKMDWLACLYTQS